MAKELQIVLLGTPSVTLDSEPVTGFVSSKAQALVYYLAATGGAHTREALAGLLWSDVPDASARRNLRDVLSNLRRLIGPYLHITRQTVSFDWEAAHAVAVDSERFATLTESRATPMDLEEIEVLSEAVDLYQGEFLAGFYVPDAPLFEEWVLGERARVRRELEEALERLADGHRKRGQFKPAIAFAQRLLSLDSLKESTHRALIEMYAWSGDRAAALRQYQACVQTLEEELDIEPAAETTELYERVRAGEFRADVPERRVRRVRGYELRERIGAGGFGAVYRAYQPTVGREVAVKVILPQYANHPEFIRRFEVEAQLVARLEHPHIVPLYDYWRAPDGAYLVMRWLRGGSLGAALQRGPWKAEAATRLVDQIAAALATAHRQGVVHRDIKPANILLDEEGNAYLSDFGIAKDLESAVELTQTDIVTGSPAYVSPEQVQSERVTPLTDVYSLGVVLYELLTGAHPFPDESFAALLLKHLSEPLPPVWALRPDLPPAVDEVIQRATAKDPVERFPDAVALADAFRQALTAELLEALPLDVVPLPEPINPYKGLRSFMEADAADFFGREAPTEQLVARLTEGEGTARFLAVMGPSGSGKSSVVRAGLIPALRQGALPGSENWFVVEMFPGAYPLEELEAALLRIAINPPPTLIEQLGKDEYGLLRAIKRVLPGDEGDQRRRELVLVIDQFEELFTLVEDEEARTHFLDSLVVAVADPRSRLRVILTLRADFYDRPLQYRNFGELLRTRMETVLPLSPEELERAITGPAERVGVALESGLEAKIVADVVDQPGALPLLQYALTELFERRDNGTLTLDAYRSLGGVLGALGRRAEELYTGLDPVGQEATRQLFLRLVTLGEGVEDTRRRVLRAELEALQSTEVLDTVIGQCGRYRLLTFDRDAETRAPTVEVAHEALLREWRRLREWIDKNRTDVQMQRSLAAATAAWDASGREPSYLLRGARLVQFESWATESAVALTGDERALLEASGEERRQSEEARRAQQERELALERTAVRRLRAIAGVLLAASVVGIILTLALFRQGQMARNEALARATQQAFAEAEAQARATQQAVAEHQTRMATARELAAAAVSNLDVDPERSILLAMQAVTETYTVDQIVLPEAEDALHRAVQALRLEFTLPGPGFSAFSPGGTRLATAGADNTAKIWDAATGQELLTLSGHTSDTLGVYVAFSPDGTRLVTASADRTAKIWDAATGQELLTLTGHTAGLVYAIFSSDDTRLATTSLDGTARVWDAETGRELLVLPHSGMTAGLAFNPDGSRLAVADHDAFMARVWDVSSGQELFTLTGHTEGVNDVAYSPDGNLLVTASSDATAKLWDAATGEEVRTILDSAFVFAIEFSPDGARLATGSTDGTAKVWDVGTGQKLLTLAGHSARITKVSFSPDGKRLTTSSTDRTTKVWDISPEGSREWLTLAGHSDLVYSVAYSPSGDRLATASWDGTAKVWDASSGRESLTLSGHTHQLTGIIFSPNGTLLATTSVDRTAKVWDAATGEELLSIDVAEADVTGDIPIAFSPDGKLLAIGRPDGMAKVWDAVTGDEIATFTGHGDWIFRVAFSPDGMYLATAGWDGTAKVWDLVSGQEVLTLSGHTDRVNSVAFSPDGMYLATASWDGTAKMWLLASNSAGDLVSGQEVFTLAGHTDLVWDVAFSPDGSHLATISFDGWARVWNVASGQQVLAFADGNNGVDVTFSPDGRRLATTRGDGTVRVYVLPIEDLMALARSRVTRSLTTEECRQYLHVDECPSAP